MISHVWEDPDSWQSWAKPCVLLRSAASLHAVSLILVPVLAPLPSTCRHV